MGAVSLGPQPSWYIRRMIDAGALDALPPRERHALEHLADGSTLLRVAPGASAEVRARAAARLEVVDGNVAPLARLAADPKSAFGAGSGVVRVPAALLRLVADLLTQASDATAPRDRHGRPVSEANAMVEAGVARVAVVSRLARALDDAVRRAAGDREVLVVSPWPGGMRWAAALTHDLDVGSLWPLFTTLRLTELLRKGEVGRALATLGAGVRSALRDPIRSGVQEALATELEHIVTSTWFIICATPTFATLRAGDVTYRPESRRVRAILRALREAGHELGLHGSFETARDGGSFVAQRERLASLAGDEVRGVRQHFLKREPGVTERAMAAAGFAFDSTCGFADRNGFRAGVADVFPVWDGSAGEPLALEELPFCWMDRAQSKYQGIEDPARWIDDARELAGECEAVQGAWCGIWHPNLTASLGFPGASEAYASLVGHLVERGAWIAPAGDVVRWRVARRSLRVEGVDASGAPIVRGDDASVRAAADAFVIADGTGRVTCRIEAR